MKEKKRYEIRLDIKIEAIYQSNLTWSEYHAVSSNPSNINIFPCCFTSLFSTELTLNVRSWVFCDMKTKRKMINHVERLKYQSKKIRF